MYSIAQIIWALLIHTSQIICTVLPDTTHHHWLPMLYCLFNSHPDFTQSCSIQTFTQIAIHWQPMFNCPFNSNPDFAKSGLILFSPFLHIYVKNSTQHGPHLPTPPWNFCWTKVHFVGPLIAPILGFVWPSHGFQRQSGSLEYCLTCLHEINLRVTYSATPAFSTNRSVNCMGVYTAGLSSGNPSCKQRRAGSLGPLSQQMSMYCVLTYNFFEA